MAKIFDTAAYALKPIAVGADQVPLGDSASLTGGVPDSKNLTMTNLAAFVAANGITLAGVAGVLTATAPVATANAQAGKSITITASAAVDGASGHAASAGGDINLVTGASVNSGRAGVVFVPATAANIASIAPAGTPTSGMGLIAGGIYFVYSGVTRVVFDYANNLVGIGSNAVMAWGSSADATSSPDVGLIRAAAGVLAVSTGSVSGWIQNTSGHLVANTSPTNATNTLASTNLAWTLLAGRSYSIKGKISGGNSTAAEGLKFALTADGTLTATYFDLEVIGTNGTVVAGAQRVTSLGTPIVFTTYTATSDTYFTGVIKCNVAGVLTLQFAEGVAHTLGTATLNAGSWVEINDMVAV